jgi:hypothetical protein
MNHSSNFDRMHRAPGAPIMDYSHELNKMSDRLYEQQLATRRWKTIALLTTAAAIAAITFQVIS